MSFSLTTELKNVGLSAYELKAYANVVKSVNIVENAFKERSEFRS